MMARKLPSDLEEEILVRVPPLSLLRFRSVCKEWNNLFKNKRFVNKNFACSPQEFMLKTKSKMYSISVNLNEDPTIKVRDLCFDLRRSRYDYFGTCDGYFFMYELYKGGVASNPLLRQTKWIATDGTTGCSCMGYDGSRPEKSYKLIGMRSCSWLNTVTRTFEVFRFATNVWKVTDHQTSSLEESTIKDEYCGVSLNGNLYWPAHNLDTGEFFIRMLDFSKEIIKPFCILPCKAKKKFTHSRILSVYKGDRFSVLEQRKSTREIEIWVTKKKIGNGDDVVWIKFMTISIPYFPIVTHYPSSYFVDNNIYGKSYVVCCRSKKPAQAWVYIVRGDMCKKIKIDEVACDEFQSSVFVPSLITIP